MISNVAKKDTITFDAEAIVDVFLDGSNNNVGCSILLTKGGPAINRKKRRTASNLIGSNNFSRRLIPDPTKT